jgi:cytochrome P450
VAIHTTTELLTGTLLDLAQNNEFIDSLREEMIPVLKEQNTVGNGDAEGTVKTSWKKNSLYKLKLLDSALKESQRMHTRDIGELLTCGRLFAGKRLTQYSQPLVSSFWTQP